MNPRLKTKCSAHVLSWEVFIFIPLVFTKEWLVMESIGYRKSKLELCGFPGEACEALWHNSTYLKSFSHSKWLNLLHWVSICWTKHYLNGNEGEKFLFKGIVICNEYWRHLFYPEGMCNAFGGGVVRQKHSSTGKVIQLDILKVLGVPAEYLRGEREVSQGKLPGSWRKLVGMNEGLSRRAELFEQVLKISRELWRHCWPFMHGLSVQAG